MGIGSALPFIGMMVVEIAQAGLLIVGKEAILTGMTNFTYVFYSNALSTLVLLPTSFLVHRSRPPLTFSLICSFFMLGVLGCLTQLIGYAAYQYTPASFASAMMNLIPAFTFILAVIFRFEKADCGSKTTLAKSIGTVVSITGAFIATLYQGPALLMPPSDSSSSNFFTPETNLVLGGSLYVLNCVVAAGFIIVQAMILKKYSAELIVLFFYCFFITIVSVLLSWILEGDQSSWSLKPTIRLIAVLYSGIFGAAFQVGIGMWCIPKTGPLFVAMFHPMGIIIAAVVGVIVLGDTFYLGTLVGSIVIVIGFYSFVWAKNKEINKVDYKVVTGSESTSKKAPLLKNDEKAPPLKNDG